MDQRDTTSILWCAFVPITAGPCLSGIEDTALCRSGFLGTEGGHLNWADADYAGKLKWESWSSHVDSSIDVDYNVLLNTAPVPGGAPGVQEGVAPVTASDGKAGNLNMEFDARETVENYYGLTWWRRLHQAVYHETGPTVLVGPPEPPPPLYPGDPPPPTVSSILDGHDAVAIGLAGLDVEHDAASELHPVHVLAIREMAPEVVKKNPQDDTWAFFARNWGNEGPCSSHQHMLEAQVISIELPPPESMAGAVGSYNGVKSNFVHGRGGGTASLAYGADGGTYITFTLPPPDQYGFVAGEVHLQWAVPSGPNARRQTRALQPVPTTLTRARDQNGPGGAEPGSAEALMNGALASLTKSQRQYFQRIVPAWRAPVTPGGASPLTPMVTVGSVVKRTVAVGQADVYDAEQVAKVEARIIALCVATKGRPAVNASLCDQYPGGKLPHGEPVVMANPSLPVSATNPVIHLFQQWPLPPPASTTAPRIWIAAAVVLVIVLVGLTLGVYRRQQRTADHGDEVS